MTVRRKPVVAIDGPAGAGKSSVSRHVAERLGYFLLDTGALYRCVGLCAARAGGEVTDAAMGKIAMDLADRGAIRFIGVDAEGVAQVTLDGEDVSAQIRTADAGQWASRVSTLPAVRAALLEMQRAVGREGGVVVEGRDIGTVVFPDAEAKFYLTASETARAQRRYEQLGGAEGTHSVDQIAADVRRRDQRDSSRAAAPLRQADDAVLIDSTGLGLEEVVDLIVARVRAVAEELESRALARA